MGPVWLPVRPHLCICRYHLARVGRLARTSVLLLMLESVWATDTAVSIHDFGGG